ncbi:hypothetical protein LXA43DRAFT_980938 [Ganoderma leucocontextum]|nr:hypothetical protein LXA43DRAFT_980938 [Ganoderma leucocontextum]
MIHLDAHRAAHDSLPVFVIVIPPEIFYRVYHFLTDDFHTLSACTRVSKQWHDVARHCLFSSIVVRGQAQYSKFCNLVEHHPGVGTCISQLEIHPGSTSSFAGDTAETLDLALLSTVVPKLTSLRRLTFWIAPAVTWEAMPVEACPPTSPVALEELHFAYTDRDVAHGLPSLYRLLSRLGSIDTLVFEALNPFSGHTPVDPSALAQSVRIRRLVFKGCAAQAVHVSYFHRVVVPGALQSVALSIPHYLALDAVTRLHAFFKESAANVVDLEIRCLRDIPISPADRTRPEEHLYTAWKLLGETIRACSKLQRLRLRAPGTQTLTEGTHGFLATFATFQTILGSVPPTIREVTARLGTNLSRAGRSTHVPGVQFWDLRALDTIFARARVYPELCQVNVEVMPHAGGDPFADLEAMVLSSLPKLRAAGLLQVIEGS